MLPMLFGLASFVTAGLLFMIQPMVGKMVLPNFGGSPAVWNAAMLFFQAVLLLGYWYAHVTTRRIGPRRHVLPHVALFASALVLLPVHIGSDAELAVSGNPALAVLVVLAVGTGLPFFLLSTSGPLLQRWFAETDHPRANDPYFLYAAGNVGSLGALVGYPLLVEPHFGIGAQARGWTVVYVGAVLLVGVCGWAVRRGSSGGAGDKVAEDETPPLSWPTRLKWIWLAFLPSSTFLGATTFLSTDVSPMPLLWVFPLAIYLVTFIVAFGVRSTRVTEIAVRLLPSLVLVVAILGITDIPLRAALPLHLSVVAVVGFTAHGMLADSRPPVARLTDFYLMISVGGAFGGLFNAILAPLIFDMILEYGAVLGAALVTVTLTKHSGRLPRVGRVGRFSLVATLVVLPLALDGLADVAGEGLGLAAVLVAATLFGVSRLGRTAWAALGVAGLLVFSAMGSLAGEYAERTFFGVHRVRATDDSIRLLFNGTTLHGAQAEDEPRRSIPLTYYHPSGPLGDIMEVHENSERIGVVGLGTGAIAAYGRAEQLFVFHEIDREVIWLARDSGLFTYVEDSEAASSFVLGDGRLTLEDEEETYDLLVLDAFSSDAIPVHLLTREALDVYRRAASRDAPLAFHISNRHLDLAPVLAWLAKDSGLEAVKQFAGGDGGVFTSPSHWVVLGPPNAVEPLLEVGWSRLEPNELVRWTDDYSNLLAVIR